MKNAFSFCNVESKPRTFHFHHGKHVKLWLFLLCLCGSNWVAICLLISIESMRLKWSTKRLLIFIWSYLKLVKFSFTCENEVNHLYNTSGKSNFFIFILIKGWLKKVLVYAFEDKINFYFSSLPKIFKVTTWDEIKKKTLAFLTPSKCPFSSWLVNL